MPFIGGFVTGDTITVNALRAGTVIEALSSGPRNVVAADTGMCFVATSGSTISFNLPATATGLSYSFIQGGAGSIRLNPNGSDAISVATTTGRALTTASTGNITSSGRTTITIVTPGDGVWYQVGGGLNTCWTIT